MTPVSAHDVAAELRRRLPQLGTKKLHKLLYYCQGHHLAQVGEPLFVETISAWDMGPVVGSLWHRERTSGQSPTPSALGEAQLNTVGYVVSRYGRLSGADLETLTHGEAPWREADVRRAPGTSARIRLESLERFFGQAETDEDEQDTPLPDGEAVRAWLAGAEERADVAASADSADRLRARLTSGE